MATFLKGDRPSVVWNPEKDKEACRFTEATMEVTDPFLAALLVAAGYEFQGEIPVVQDEEVGEPEIVPEKQAAPEKLAAEPAKPSRARGPQTTKTK